MKPSVHRPISAYVLHPMDISLHLEGLEMNKLDGLVSEAIGCCPK